jgi:hypothetical protein
LSVTFDAVTETIEQPPLANGVPDALPDTETK